MRIIVNLHNRRQPAGTDAGYSFQSKAQVIGRMSGLNTQLLFQSLQNCLPPRTWQAVPWQTRITLRPRGLRWNNE